MLASELSDSSLCQYNKEVEVIAERENLYTDNEKSMVVSELSDSSLCQNNKEVEVVTERENLIVCGQSLTEICSNIEELLGKDLLDKIQEELQFCENVEEEVHALREARNKFQVFNDECAAVIRCSLRNLSISYSKHEAGACETLLVNVFRLKERQQLNDIQLNEMLRIHEAIQTSAAELRADVKDLRQGLLECELKTEKCLSQDFLCNVIEVLANNTAELQSYIVTCQVVDYKLKQLYSLPTKEKESINKVIVQLLENSTQCYNTSKHLHEELILLEQFVGYVEYDLLEVMSDNEPTMLSICSLKRCLQKIVVQGEKLDHMLLNFPCDKYQGLVRLPEVRNAKELINKATHQFKSLLELKTDKDKVAIQVEGNECSSLISFSADGFANNNNIDDGCFDYANYDLQEGGCSPQDVFTEMCKDSSHLLKIVRLVERNCDKFVRNAAEHGSEDALVDETIHLTATLQDLLDCGDTNDGNIDHIMNKITTTLETLERDFPSNKHINYLRIDYEDVKSNVKTKDSTPCIEPPASQTAYSYSCEDGFVAVQDKIIEDTQPATRELHREEDEEEFQDVLSQFDVELDLLQSTLNEYNINYLPLVNKLLKSLSESASRIEVIKSDCKSTKLQKEINLTLAKYTSVLDAHKDFVFKKVVQVIWHVVVTMVTFEEACSQLETFGSHFLADKDDIKRLLALSEIVQKEIDLTYGKVKLWRTLDVCCDKLKYDFTKLETRCAFVDRRIEVLHLKQLLIEDDYMRLVQYLHDTVTNLVINDIHKITETIASDCFTLYDQLNVRLGYHQSLELAPVMLSTIQHTLGLIKFKLFNDTFFHSQPHINVIREENVSERTMLWKRRKKENIVIVLLPLYLQPLVVSNSHRKERKLLVFNQPVVEAIIFPLFIEPPRYNINFVQLEELCCPKNIALCLGEKSKDNSFSLDSLFSGPSSSSCSANGSVAKKCLSGERTNNNKILNSEKDNINIQCGTFESSGVYSFCTDESMKNTKLLPLPPCNNHLYETGLLSDPIALGSPHSSTRRQLVENWEVSCNGSTSDNEDSYIFKEVSTLESLDLFTPGRRLSNSESYVVFRSQPDEMVDFNLYHRSSESSETSSEWGYINNLEFPRKKRASIEQIPAELIDSTLHENAFKLLDDCANDSTQYDSIHDFSLETFKVIMLKSSNHQQSTDEDIADLNDFNISCNMTSLSPVLLNSNEDCITQDIFVNHNITDSDLSCDIQSSINLNQNKGKQKSIFIRSSLSDDDFAPNQVFNRDNESISVLSKSDSDKFNLPVPNSYQYIHCKLNDLTHNATVNDNTLLSFEFPDNSLSPIQADLDSTEISLCKSKLVEHSSMANETQSICNSSGEVISSEQSSNETNRCNLDQINGLSSSNEFANTNENSSYSKPFHTFPCDPLLNETMTNYTGGSNKFDHFKNISLWTGDFENELWSLSNSFGEDSNRQSTTEKEYSQKSLMLKPCKGNDKDVTNTPQNSMEDPVDSTRNCDSKISVSNNISSNHSVNHLDMTSPCISLEFDNVVTPLYKHKAYNDVTNDTHNVERHSITQSECLLIEVEDVSNINSEKDEVFEVGSNEEVDDSPLCSPPIHSTSYLGDTYTELLSENFSDQNQASLFLELANAEQKIEKDEIFANTADKLHAKLVPVDDNFERANYVVNNQDLPRSSTPLHTPSNLSAHIRNLTPSSNKSCLQHNETPDVNELETVNNAEHFQTPLTVSLRLEAGQSPLKSPLLGINSVESSFVGKNIDPVLDEFVEKVQSCLDTMLVVSDLVSEHFDGDQTEEKDFDQTLNLFAQLGSQQSTLDSLNLIGKQIQSCEDLDIRERVQEKLDIVNESWNLLQSKTFRYKGRFREGMVTPVVSPGDTSDSEDDLHQHAHLNYQVMFTELFDWLSCLDETLSFTLPANTSIQSIEEKMILLQELSKDMCVHTSIFNKLVLAWSNMTDQNQSLCQQQQDICELWEYIAEKLARKASMCHKAVPVFDIRENTSIKWEKELINNINDILKLLKANSGILKNNKAFAAAATVFKISLSIACTMTGSELKMQKAFEPLINLHKKLNIPLDIDDDVEVDHMGCIVPSTSPETQNGKRWKHHFDQQLFFAKEMEQFLSYLYEQEDMLSKHNGLSSNRQVLVESLASLQALSQGIKAKELPLKYIHTEFNIAVKDFDLNQKYLAMVEHSENFYNKIMKKSESVMEVVFLMRSLEKHKQYLLPWLLKMDQQYVQPLLSRNEMTLNDAIMKCMNLSDVERRLADKKSYIHCALEDANKLLIIVESTEAVEFSDNINNAWSCISTHVFELRHRLDLLVSAWREFKTLSENLEQFLSRLYISVDTDTEHINQEHLRIEEELLEKASAQLAKKQTSRESLRTKHQDILKFVNHLPCTPVDKQMESIEKQWLELESKIVERSEVLKGVSEEIKWVCANERYMETAKCVDHGEELMSMYEGTPSLSTAEMAEEIILFQDLSSRLSALQETHRNLLQSTDERRWSSQGDFQNETALLCERYSSLLESTNERLTFVVALHDKLNNAENMIADCESQLVNVAIVISKLLESFASYEEVKEHQKKLEVAERVISRLQKVLHHITKVIHEESPQHVACQSISARVYAFETRLRAATKDIECARERFSACHSLTNVEDELSHVESFLETSQQFFESASLNTSKTSHDLLALGKQIKSLLDEISHKQDQLASIREQINSYSAVVEPGTDISEDWCDLAERLASRLQQLHAFCTQKHEQLSKMAASLSQFEEDYIDLERWMSEKEVQYERLCAQAPSANNASRLLDSCKKLQLDLPVFVAFSESMTSLIMNHACVFDYVHVDDKLRQLNARYELLEEQTQLLLKRITYISSTPSALTKLCDAISHWFKDLTSNSNKVFPNFGEYSTHVQTNLDKCARYKKSLEELADSELAKDGLRDARDQELLDRLATTQRHLELQMEGVEILSDEMEEFDDEAERLRSAIKALLERIDSKDSVDELQVEEESLKRRLSRLRDDVVCICNASANCDIETKLEASLTSLTLQFNEFALCVESYAQESALLDAHAQQFDESAKMLLTWMKGMGAKLESMETKMKNSNVGILKECFEELKELKAEKASYQDTYQHTLAQSKSLLVAEAGAQVASSLELVTQNLRDTWQGVDSTVNKRFDEMKEIMFGWADYTEMMRDAVYWLRGIEEFNKQPMHKLEVEDLKERLFQLEKMAHDFASRETTEPAIKQLVVFLSRVSIDEDQLVLHQQFASFTQLWSSTRAGLSEQTYVTSQLLEWLDTFAHQKDVLCTWLKGIEHSVFSQDLVSSPEKQKERIKQIYGSDMVRYEKIRESLKSVAIKVLSHAPTSAFSAHVRAELNHIGNRWLTLCDRLGMTYKRVEETLFLLKLLEEMLRLLDKWLNDVSSRVECVQLDKCNVEEMKYSIEDLEVVLSEFSNREQDFVSISELCTSVRESPEACPFPEDLEILLECSEGFKTRWNETRKKCDIYKSFLENRLAVYYEWESESQAVSSWLSEQKTINGEFCQDFQGQSPNILKSLQRMRKCCDYLVGVASTVPCKISQCTDELQESFRNVQALFKTRGNVAVPSVSYNETEHYVENWLSEVEIEMIRLQPYASEEDFETSRQRLKELNSELRGNFNLIEKLNELSAMYTGMIDTSRNNVVEELNGRYEKALNDTAAWIDLTVPILTT